jgi:hypothetical protein
MAEENRSTRELAVQAATAIWQNKISRTLLFILLAFEIYNTAILPAVQGTYNVGKLKAEECSAKMKVIAYDLSPDQQRAALAKFKRECGSYFTGE